MLTQLNVKSALQDMTTEITEDSGWKLIDHSVEERKADSERIRQRHAEIGSFFDMLPKKANGHPVNQATANLGVKR
ncbi:Hypp8649 [Branchiostoma lanceolatum]|uniref:Hypp8649 protein n=1 Tax=Branchiostoma lanceolatum TaxID=7740 RepID=A0A8K0EI12_BRALA|nr:Hypp8649 [Branchiostoma lanceolatum]